MTGFSPRTRSRVGATRRRLGDQVRVGDVGAGQPDEIAYAAGDHPVGVLQVDHARRGDQRDLRYGLADGGRRIGDRVELDRRRGAIHVDAAGKAE